MRNQIEAAAIPYGDAPALILYLWAKDAGSACTQIPDILSEHLSPRGSEEVLEHSTVDINDPCTHVVGNQPVEKSHLAAGVTDVSNRRNVRQVIGQLRAFVGQVESYRSIIDDVELSEQS